MNEWISKPWYIYTMETTRQEKGTNYCYTQQVNLKVVILSERNQSQIINVV